METSRHRQLVYPRTREDIRQLCLQRALHGPACESKCVCACLDGNTGYFVT